MIVAWCVGLGASAAAASPVVSGEQLVQRLPEQPRARSRALADLIVDGAAPASVLRFVPLRYRAPDAAGQLHDVELRVTADYLAVGTEDGFVYAPLGLPDALRVAAALDAVLPTPAIVDRVHAAADKLTPHPLPPSPKMASTEVLLEHQRAIDATRPGDRLVAGHKKDVVLTARLVRRPDRVAIYGWHEPDGTPIQPLSLWHGAHYVDYSHGVRLVAREAAVDGVRHDVQQLLTDPLLAPLVASEGALPTAWASAALWSDQAGFGGP